MKVTIKEPEQAIAKQPTFSDVEAQAWFTEGNGGAYIKLRAHVLLEGFTYNAISVYGVHRHFSNTDPVTLIDRDAGELVLVKEASNK